MNLIGWCAGKGEPEWTPEEEAQREANIKAAEADAKQQQDAINSANNRPTGFLW
jgi:hypothetical protein